jgi:hypothetical protein
MQYAREFSPSKPEQVGSVRSRSYDQRPVTLCALCRRNLLAGERYRYWENGDQGAAARIVCGLCEGGAARDGWRRTEREPERENAVGLRPVVRLVA